MPTYTFFNRQSGIEYDDIVSMAEYDEYMKNNPNIERVWHGCAPALSGDHLMGVGPKNDNAFNDVMKNIASKHPDSPMADKYGSGKSTKRLQAENVYKKHKARK
jgi:hypothetical protein|tara:strand:+ start:915 stop:1226 length:312 start_codon:yes stop_codon:yes gene_type:complete